MHKRKLNIHPTLIKPGVHRNIEMKKTSQQALTGADKGFKWGGGARFFRNKIINNSEQKIVPHAKFFFDLKDSKRVKINDLRLKKLDFLILGTNITD